MLHVVHDTKAFVDVSRTLAIGVDQKNEGSTFDSYFFRAGMIIDLCNINDRIKIEMGPFCLTYDPRKHEEVEKDLILSNVKRHIRSIVESYKPWAAEDNLGRKVNMLI